jgi:hypothetical protein
MRRKTFERTGKHERDIRRQLILADRPMTTSELRRALIPGEWKDWHRRDIRFAAAKFCEPVGRAGGRGTPTLWRLKSQ